MDISTLDMELLNTILLIIAVIGTVSYAISGALTGIESKLDLFGVIVLAVITATGGGLLRDLILGKSRFVIFEEWWYPLIAFAVSGLVFAVMWFIKDLSWADSRAYRLTYLIIDYVGLGAFVIVGVLRAKEAEAQNTNEVWYQQSLIDYIIDKSSLSPIYKEQSNNKQYNVVKH